jgi:hypothetical protein
MRDVQSADAVRGKTIRFTWTEGPTKGTTHEHVFHENGTVEWRDTSPQKDRSTIKQQKSPPANERPKYGAIRVADDIYAVSYLAGSGYTLTVVLNFLDHRIVGFASSSKEWYPVQGSFEVVGSVGDP